MMRKSGAWLGVGVVLVWACAACDDGGSGTTASNGGALADAGGGQGGAPAGGALVPDLGGTAGAVPDAAPPAPDAAVDPVPEGCNPVGGEWDCLMPFPSDVYRVADPGLPSGFRVEIPEVAQPRNYDGEHLNMLALHPADGFSPASQIMALVPHDLAPGQLVTLDGDYTVSLRPESRTVLIDATTGERVLHIADVDLRAPDAARRALILRPQVRLKDSTRYIVGIRRLNDAAGAAIASPESFEALRAGAAPADLQARYDAEIFPALADAGAPKDDLLLAWDFTTRSEDQVTSDMLSVRAQTIDALRDHPPVLKGAQVTEPADGPIFRRLDGVMEVPLFMETPNVGAHLHRGPDGRPALNGTADVPFLAIIPRSIGENPAEPGRFLQFGHGFFGQRIEIADNFVYEFAQDHRMVVAGVDWWGMSTADSPDVIAQIINNPAESLRFVERVHQGMANFIALSYAAKTSLHDLAEMQVDAAPTYTADEVYFYGISQGGILGGTYMALAPNVSRGVLSVGGAGFAMLMQRARPFIPFINVIAAQYADPLDQQKFQTLSQLTLDRIDPMTYAPHLIVNPYPDSPPARRVLMQLGVGDSQVPNLGHHTMARSLDIPLLTPANRAIPGIREDAGPIAGSALVEFSFGIPEPLPGTFSDFPAEGNGAHEGVRRSRAGQAQIDGFFRPDGVIAHTCDGPCDPE